MAPIAIDMELKNTVFLIAPVQFSEVSSNRNIIYPIIKYSTEHFIFCHEHVFFSTDFAGFRCPARIFQKACTV